MLKTGAPKPKFCSISFHENDLNTVMINEVQGIQVTGTQNYREI